MCSQLARIKCSNLKTKYRVVCHTFFYIEILSEQDNENYDFSKMGIDTDQIRGDYNMAVFNCAVCKGLLFDPRTIKGCQHTYCKACVPGNHDFLEPSVKEKCPECRKEFMNDDDLKPPTLFMRQALAEIKIECGFPQCGKIVTYYFFRHHKVG